MIKSIAVALIIAGCQPLTTAQIAQQLDSRLDIQAQLNGAAVVHLSAGTFTIDTPTTTRTPWMISVPPEVELRGEGDSTVLKFTGDVGNDWWGVYLNSGASLRSLRIDTSELYNSSEQTHAIYFARPSTGITVSGVTINHPVRVGEDGGDCIDIVGYSPNQMVRDVHITHNTFEHCDRSGVESHGGTDGVEIGFNVFNDTGDLSINSEGTGDQYHWNIHNNVINTSVGAQGPFDIALDLMQGVSVVDNVLNGRSISLFSCNDCSIVHNTINRTRTGTEAAIDGIKDTGHVSIIKNAITRTATAGAGSVIHFGSHGTGRPHDIQIVDNDISSEVPGSIIATEDAVNVLIADNRIVHSNSGTTYGFNASGPNRRTTGLVYSNNTTSGPLSRVVNVSGHYNGTGTLALINSTATGSTYGMVCEDINDSGGILGPVTYTGNGMVGPICGGLQVP